MQNFKAHQTMNLNTELAKIILEGLKAYRVHSDESLSTPKGVTVAQWEEIIDKMILAFEYQADPAKMFKAWEDENTQALIKEGLFLFGEYYDNLYW